MKEILSEALELVKPSRKDEIEGKKRVDEFLKKLKVPEAKVIVGGSAKKGTWLKDVHDADFFVKFNYSKYSGKSDELSNILEKYVKRSYPKYVRLHGSRDYFQIKIDGFLYEVIPILDINKADQALNITDISPLHAKWVAKHKDKVDQIRLTKAFCKAQDIYGAESYISGFSGYVCEILTIHYGSFLNLLKAAVKWKEKQVIDIEKYHTGNNVLMELNKSKIQSPLIVIDPVQADRNAAAALSLENFNLFKKKAKDFLKKPSLKFFTKQEVDLKKMAGKNELIVLEAENLKGKDDIVGCKLLKVIEHIRKALVKNEFNVLDSGLLFAEKKSRLYFIIKKEKMADTILVQGPPTFAKEHVKKFRKLHKNTFIREKVVYAKDKRMYMDAESLIKDRIKDEYVKERVKSIKIKK